MRAMSMKFALVASLVVNVALAGAALREHSARATDSAQAYSDARKLAEVGCERKLEHQQDQARIDAIWECNAHYGRFPDCINVPPWTPDTGSKLNEAKAP
jgi:hypothetical protein